MEGNLANANGSNKKFVSSKAASEALFAHPNTLRRWAKAGDLPYIVTPGGKFRYDVETYVARTLRDPKVA